MLTGLTAGYLSATHQRNFQREYEKHLLWSKFDKQMHGSHIERAQNCSCSWVTVDRCVPTPFSANEPCWYSCCLQHRRRRIIGMGLSKTGTTALSRAIANVGFRVAHNHGDLLSDSCQAITNTLEDRYEELDQRYPNATFVITHTANVSAWIFSLQSHIQRYPKMLLHEHNATFLPCFVYGCVSDKTNKQKDTKVAVDTTGTISQPRELRRLYEAYYRQLFKYFAGRDYAYVDVRSNTYSRLSLIHPHISTPFPLVNARNETDKERSQSWTGMNCIKVR